MMTSTYFLMPAGMTAPATIGSLFVLAAFGRSDAER